MHLFPLLVVPLFLVIYYTYKQLGMNSDIPLQPQGRVDYWASQAAVAIRAELVGCHFSSSSSNSEVLCFRSKGQELELSCSEGVIKLKREDGHCSELAVLGSDGTVAYDLTASHLMLQLLAKQDGHYKKLELRIPQTPA
jgi:hypothetical protein